MHYVALQSLTVRELQGRPLTLPTCTLGCDETMKEKITKVKRKIKIKEKREGKNEKEKKRKAKRLKDRKEKYEDKKGKGWE